MHKVEAEKILTNILETFGLQDDRIKTMFKLMYALGFSYQDALDLTKPESEPTMKYVEDMDTVRQRNAFREWFTAKEQKAAPLNFVYDMFLEHIQAKNELEMEVDELKSERGRIKVWADKLADKISDVTGTDIRTDVHPWAAAIEALDEYSTRSVPQKPSFDIEPTIDLPFTAMSTPAGKPKAWFYIRADGTNGISSNVDIAKQSAGTDGSVFGLWTQDSFSFDVEHPASAWWAYQTEVSYLIRELTSGSKRYPNVAEWVPLYLEKSSYEYTKQYN